MSGDDSDGWEEEEDRVMAIMAAKKAEEDEAADALEDVVEEVHEWSLPLDMEEGNPDEKTLIPPQWGRSQRRRSMRWWSTQ